MTITPCYRSPCTRPDRHRGLCSDWRDKFARRYLLPEPTSKQTIWLFWVALFFVIEFDAIFSKNYAATLTANFRKWFAFEDSDLNDTKLPRAGQARRVGGLLLLTWIFAHLIFKQGTF